LGLKKGREKEENKQKMDKNLTTEHILGYNMENTEIDAASEPPTTDCAGTSDNLTDAAKTNQHGDTSRTATAEAIPSHSLASPSDHLATDNRTCVGVTIAVSEKPAPINLSANSSPINLSVAKKGRRAKKKYNPNNGLGYNPSLVNGTAPKPRTSKNRSVPAYRNRFSYSRKIAAEACGMGYKQVTAPRDVRSLRQLSSPFPEGKNRIRERDTSWELTDRRVA
jgi:hypothetical protein